MRLRSRAWLFFSLTATSGVGCSLTHDLDSVLCPQSDPDCADAASAGGSDGLGGGSQTGGTGADTSSGGSGTGGNDSSDGGAPPVDEGCPEAGTIQARYQNGLVQGDDATSGRIRAYFQIENTGGDDVDLSTLRLRYYFTDNAAIAPQYDCAFVLGVGSGECSGTVTAEILDGEETGATSILELTFSEGLALLRRRSITLDINGSILGQAGGDFDQKDDYSYSELPEHVNDDVNGHYGVWDRVTVHCGSTLLWGTPPGD